MPHDIDITLDEPLAGFVREQIHSGRFKSESEVVLAALSLLQEREAKMEALRSALVAGEQSGPAQAVELHGFLSDVKAKYKLSRHG